MTSSRSGEVAVTVAVRGRLLTSAISPKKSPAPIVFTLRPLRRTSAVPSMSTKNSRPGSPSVVSTLPSGMSISSATRATLPSSLFEQWAKSGARLRSSILASRRSTARV